MRKLPKREEIKPFPDHERVSPNAASYVISNFGRVYRVDQAQHEGETHTLTPCKLVPSAQFLKVRLSGGRLTRSVPAAIQTAFGNLPIPEHDPEIRNRQWGQKWRLRIDPNAPTDEETGQARCSVVDVEWIYCTTHLHLQNDPGFIVPAHHVIPIWWPRRGPKYPNYRDLKEFHSKRRAP